MWIARDKNGELWLFENKPVKENDIWNNPSSDYMKILDTTLFSDLKWEDEPMEVDLVDVNKSIITDKDCIDEVYWREVRNNAAMALMTVILDKQDDFLSKPMLEDVADLSVDCANILVKKLKNKDIKL